jgi:putative membrane protein
LLAAWDSVVTGLPVLLVHLGTTTGLFLAALALYIWLTPYREIQLIRDGNIAAAITLSGQMLALAIPLAAMMAHSVSVPDIILWGVVTVILQLTAFAAVAVLIRHLPAAIERGEIGPALVLACGQIVAGLLNAAAMSG